MDVQTRASLTSCDLRSEGNVKSHLHAEVADNPLSHHELVGSLFCRHGQEFDLVLFVYFAVESKVAYLVVAVFDLSAGLCDVVHALGAELVVLCKRRALVVAFLVCSLVETVVIRYYIVL